MPAIRGARPIRNKEVLDFHFHIEKNDLKIPALDEYAEIWKQWLNFSDNKSIMGLDEFAHADYTQGTSQTFDNFILRHSKDRQILVLAGDFQYHACMGKHVDFAYVKDVADLESVINGPGLHALLISVPFSDLGVMHPQFDELMLICNALDIPVCVDLAYWGISKNIFLNLYHYPAIKEVTSSLSKPFCTLENHRVGIRFTREYVDDGISMLNEVKMQNNFSMALGVEYMKNFSPDYNWQTYGSAYTKVCDDNSLQQTDTVIFGIGGEEFKQFNRGIEGNNRVCISDWLVEKT